MSWPHTYAQQHVAAVPKRVGVRPRCGDELSAHLYLGAPPRHRGLQSRNTPVRSRQTGSEHLYLIGDIIDGRRLRRSWFWRQTHSGVVKRVPHNCRNGTQVIYIPDTHDDCMHRYAEFSFGALTLHDDAPE